MGEKDEEGMDEKLVCSLIVNGDEEESVRGLMSSDLDNSLSMEKQSMLTDVGNCQVFGSQSIYLQSSKNNGYDDNQDQKEGGNNFL